MEKEAARAELKKAIIQAVDAGAMESMIREILELDRGYNWDLEMVMLPFLLTVDKWKKPI